jgi:hypothetical protein
MAGVESVDTSRRRHKFTQSVSPHTTSHKQPPRQRLDSKAAHRLPRHVRTDGEYGVESDRRRFQRHSGGDPNRRSRQWRTAAAVRRRGGRASHQGEPCAQSTLAVRPQCGQCGCNIATSAATAVEAASHQVIRNGPRTLRLTLHRATLPHQSTLHQSRANRLFDTAD